MDSDRKPGSPRDRVDGARGQKAVESRGLVRQRGSSAGEGGVRNGVLFGDCGFREMVVLSWMVQGHVVGVETLEVCVLRKLMVLLTRM